MSWLLVKNLTGISGYKLYLISYPMVLVSVGMSKNTLTFSENSDIMISQMGLCHNAFLKIRPLVQKLMNIFVMEPKFLAKKLWFLAETTMLLLLLMMESAKNFEFWTKSTQLFWLLTFEPVDGFSNFKKVN